MKVYGIHKGRITGFKKISNKHEEPVSTVSRICNCVGKADSMVLENSIEKKKEKIQIFIADYAPRKV
ncbi:hypothetical protein MHBO_003633 [Bonamia ostreae]|uniref:Transposase n=1 Tax=Bonamia ostreae TaxID=126728 RepID=A0ABV2ARF6_9EUKA